MAAGADTTSTNSTSSPGLRLRISCSDINLLAVSSDGGHSSSSSAGSGKYIVRGSPPVSPKQHTRYVQSSGGNCMHFSLAMSNSGPGFKAPQNPNFPTAQPVHRAGSLIHSNYDGSSSSSTSPGNRQFARSASCCATRFKLAPQGSGFGGLALQTAGSAGSSSSSSRTAAAEHGMQTGRCQHATSMRNAGNSSSSRHGAPGSLLAMSSLSEALQLCPFTGDASAGAMMLATAGFARHDKRTKATQQQLQAGQGAVQQQIEWN